MAISLQTAALSAMFASLLLAAALTYLRSIPNAPDGLSWWAGGFWAYSGANGCIGLIAPEYGAIFLETLVAMSAFMLAAGTRRFLGYTVLAADCCPGYQPDCFLGPRGRPSSLALPGSNHAGIRSIRSGADCGRRSIVATG